MFLLINLERPGYWKSNYFMNVNMTFEEYLEIYGKMTYRNVGVSMLPMLKQDRDLFTVEKKTKKRCKKYDVVLYRRPPNQYVLHRVVKVREKDYVILGDNCEKKEYGINDKDILGVVTSFIHKGKTVKSDAFFYQVYVHVWYWIYPFRRLYMCGKRHIKRLNRTDSQRN